MSVAALLALIATASLSLWPATSIAFAGQTISLVTPTSSNVSVSILPGPAALTAGQSAQFTAKVVGTTNTAVKWSMTPNAGSLLNGFYTAPTHIVSPQTVKLTATSAADSSKSASVSLVVNPIRPRVLPRRIVIVRVSPSSTSLNRGQSATFKARVSGTSNTAVTWSLSPSQAGKIANGIYQSPTTVAARQTVVVTATSVEDHAASARATIVLEPVELTIRPASVSVGAAASTTFAASVTGTSDTAVTWSLSSAVGTVVNGVYTAPATIGSAQTVTLKAASVADPTKFAMATIALTPTPPSLPGTPHFGNDGAQLTSYIPGKSMFVRSVFFSGVPQLSQYVSAFKAAQLNTLETGFYVPPGNNFSSVTDWEAYFNGFVSPIETAARVDGFNIILTGDDIARGSGAVYDAVSGPSTAWTPDPITYAFTWAKNLGKVIGVEMVDEISSQFAVPFPQGQLAQPNGPQQISCVNDLCTVTWPSPLVIENGALQFLITGATSNANLNRAMPNLYHQNAGFNNGFAFNATGVGTQTFTAATDPNLTFQMFASSGALGPTGTDYVHNNAISQIMSYIDAVPNRPSVTWPAAAAAPPSNFGAWAGPGAADYGDIYFTYFNCSDPSGCQPSDGLTAFKGAWNAKYPFAQKGKPVLMETSDYGVTYNIVSTSIPVASFDGKTITFSQPHGITTATIGVTRLSVSGNSNSSLNGNYYVYNVVDSTSLQVYSANPARTGVQGGTLTFADGQTVNLSVFPTLGYIAPTGLNMDGAEYCLHAGNFGQVATVSNSSYAGYNGQWYVFPIQFDGTPTGSTCTWSLHMTPLSTRQTGVGGTASLIADNYYHPGLSTLVQTGTSPDLTAANVMLRRRTGCGTA